MAERTQEEANSPPSNAQREESETKKAVRELKEKFLPSIKRSLLGSLIVYVAMLIIGCLAVKKCPKNENIPLFLIITGVVGLLDKFVSYIKDRLVKQFQVKYAESALYTIEVVTFFLGTYWVYKAYKPSYDPQDADYCQKTAYLFAFIYLTVIYVLAAAVLLGFICFLICIVFVIKTASRAAKNIDLDPESQESLKGEETRGADEASAASTLKAECKLEDEKK